MLMGVYLRWIRPGRVLEASAIGLVLLVVALYAGRVGRRATRRSRRCSRSAAPTLAIAVMVYGFAASVLPVWLLLAPRDYLSAFVKIGVVVALALGILDRRCRRSRCRRSRSSSTAPGRCSPGKVFPFAFITIACGAISGFHALIASGTTPKLLERETDARMIGYGAHAHGVVRRDHGADRRLRADAGRLLRDQRARAARSARRRRAPPRPFATGASRSTRPRCSSSRSRSARRSLLSRTGGAPSLARRHGAALLQRARRQRRDGALVSLRDHVRGAVHPHDARRRHARRPVHAAGPRQARLGAVRPRVVVSGGRACRARSSSRCGATSSIRA